MTNPLPDETESLIIGVPAHLLEGLRCYAVHHVPTGGFLLAVLANDLTQAVGRADETSIESLPAIVRYCYGALPHSCWGTPDKVREWLKIRVLDSEQDARQAVRHAEEGGE